jgi:protein-tyrosine phosphatase
MGGYVGYSGQRVRSGLLFRSDHLGNLSAADKVALEALGPIRVLDFRGAQERQAAVCALPSAPVHSLAIEPQLFVRLMQRHAEGHTLDVPTALLAMQDNYRSYVMDNAARYRALFMHLLEAGGPVVFHCTAGKDRTGVAAALVLHALGVSDGDVLANYLETNQRLKVQHASAPGVPQEVLQVLNRVQQGFLDAAFGAINGAYGDVHAYLDRALGVGPQEVAALRGRYLEPTQPL